MLFRQRLDVWKTACAETGRQFIPDEVALARGLTIALSKREYDDAIRLSEERVSKLFSKFGTLPGIKNERPNSYSDKGTEMDDAALIGNPEDIIRRLKVLQQMGFEYVNILLPEDKRSLRIFSEEVMPEFSRTVKVTDVPNERALA